ncbi:MAG TPA: pyridoxal phosphate-dependent aminotransferase [Thermoanaerobaculia bacterium]|nr:pyridoxal phosphate-dependent aminotransferase [Thermoanaerobaculia bacterium]
MKGSVYMRWAKEHAAASFNLANSGLLGCSTEDLVLEPGDVQVNGDNRDGYRPLLEAIGALYGVAAEQVVTAGGTSGANFLALSALVEPGDVVLIEQPTYEPILAVLRFLGARVRRFSRSFENGYHTDLDEIRALCSEPVRLVVLTNPHNPSGVMLPPEEVGEIGRIAAQAGAWLLVDEVYRDVWFESAPPSHVHLGPNLLATSSLTKSYGLSGLRCGWILAADPEIAVRLRHAFDFMEAGGAMPAASLAVAALRQLPRLIARSRAILDPNIAQVHAFLADHAEWLDCVVPERSMCVFPRLKKEEDSEPLHDWLRSRDTSIVPGKYFESPRHFRLGFAVRPEDVATGLRHLSEGLRRVA